MMPQKQDALEAAATTDYARAFLLLEEAKVMNAALHKLRKIFIDNSMSEQFAEQLQTAIRDAFDKVPDNAVPLLPIPSPSPQFVGRRQDLDAIHLDLQANKRAVLLYGVGGVGKTALALKYAHEYQTEYAHILWIRQSGQLFSSFIQSELFDNLGLVFDKHSTGLDAFLDILAKLKKLQGKNLLIVDNYEQTEDDQTHDTIGKLFALPTRWHIVCTSREDVPIFGASRKIEVLPAAEAVELFKRHATGKPCNDAEVTNLLDMVGFHTLMAELWAKTYRKCTQFGRVEELRAALQAEGLKNPYLEKPIYVGTQKITFYAHLRAVFSLSNLSYAERWLLKQWAVLPTAPHSAKDFLTWIQDSELAFEDTLLSLAEKGWLQSDDGLAYSLHPLLQLFFLAELKPTLPDCGNMYVYFRDFAASKTVGANPLAHQCLIAPIEAMIQHVNFTKFEKGQGILWDRARFLYDLLGDYSNAFRCAKECLTINKATVGERHKDYAASLNNLAELYKSQGDYNAALPLYQESLQIRKDVLGERHPDYAQSLNNLAFLYNNQGDYAAALLLYQESLQIMKEVLGEQHPDYAQSLNNLALLYNNQGDYATALPLYQESLQIRKEVLGERHPDYALALHNLAGLYESQGDYAAALPLYQESLQIWKEVLGERHPNYALALNNLGTLYFEQGNYAQARFYLSEAHSILLEKLGEQHPNTKKAKESLDYALSLGKK